MDSRRVSMHGATNSHSHQHTKLLQSYVHQVCQKPFNIERSRMSNNSDCESNVSAAITNPLLLQRPKEPWKGSEFVKSIVYAGLDSIVTSFSLISSISAGRLSSVDVLVLGFANLVADGISMGFSDYMSTTTERDVAFRERYVTAWDIVNNTKLEQRNLLERYQELGMTPSDATTVASIFAKYQDIMVDEKMVTENGMLPPDQTDKPWKHGLVTFVAFIVFGCAPILAFIILIPFTNSDKIKFIGACVLSAVALALLGIAKAKVAGQNYAASIVTTLLNGAVAGTAAYGIGWTLRNFAGLE